MTDDIGLVRFSTGVPEEGTIAVRILLVDDDEEYGRSLQEMLRGRASHAFEVELEHNLEAALKRLMKPNNFEVVLLDLDLPDSRGLDTAVMVLQAAENVPVVVLARSEDQQVAWQATQYGVQDVILRETMTAEALVWSLKHAVEQHLLRASLERHIRELELSNGRFLSLVVDNADAIVVVDRVGIVRFVNPSAEKLLRCSASDLLGQMFGIPLEGVDVTEIDLRNRPGRTQTAEIRVMRTLWDGERAFIVTMRDITERKRSELALKVAKQTAEQASAMKSQFLANMSHELRTPLNAIIGYSEMMLMGISGTLEPERYRDYVADIHKGGKHLLALINELLDLSKAESGKLDLAEEPFDIIELGREIIDLLGGEAMLAGIDYSLETSAESLWLNGDAKLIKQVLLNLASNALKFTARGGKVVIEIHRNVHGDTQVVVGDDGIGMPASEIPRAFAAFVQIENAYTRTKNKGTGLGLALCKRYVELHQGKITMDSEPDVGTTVMISFPPERAVGDERPAGSVVSLAQCAPRKRRDRAN
jgi:signal transduction histidine kinase